MAISNIIKQIPLITPALKAGSCEIDRTLLNKRIRNIFLISIALVIAAVFHPSFIFPLAALAIWVIPALDTYRTERALDQRAVNEYLNPNHAPSRLATEHIYSNIRVVKELINKKVDLNRKNDKNEKILVLGNFFGIEYYDLKIFKLLLKGGYDIKPDFYNLLKDSNFEYLEFALKENIIKVEDFSKKQQSSFLLDYAKSLKTLRLLIDHGFKIDPKVKGLSNLKLGNFEIFKLLLKNGYDIKPDFQNLLKDANFKYLEFALRENIVKAENFSEKLQSDFWLNKVESLRTAKLLVKHGFNIDAKDKKGLTPLQQLGKNDKSWNSSYVLPRPFVIKIFADTIGAIFRSIAYNKTAALKKVSILKECKAKLVWKNKSIFSCIKPKVHAYEKFSSPEMRKLLKPEYT